MDFLHDFGRKCADQVALKGGPPRTDPAGLKDGFLPGSRCWFLDDDTSEEGSGRFIAARLSGQP